MSATPNLGLGDIPQNSLNLAPAYNPTIQKLDIAVNLAAVDNTVTATPTTVAGDAGKRWIVPAAGVTGAWAGHENEIAYCVGADLWAFMAAKDGWYCPITSGANEGKTFKFDGAAWNEAVVGGSLPAASITFDNSGTSFVGANVQAVLEEVNDALATIPDASNDNVLVALDIVSGNVAIDLSAAGFFTLLLDENVTGFTITNPPAAGKGGSWAIRLRQDATGGRTVALPASFKATGGSDTAPATGANAYSLLTFTTFDNGVRYEYALQEIAA